MTQIIFKMSRGDYSRFEFGYSSGKQKKGGIIVKIPRLAEAVPCIFSPLLYRLSYLGVWVLEARIK